MLLLGLLAVVYYLAYTESGLTVVAAALNRRLGPVTIQLRGVSGTLARGVHVERLVFDHRRVHIEVDDADGRLAILPLAWRTVRVPELHMGRLLVHALPRSGEAGGVDTAFPAAADAYRCRARRCAPLAAHYDQW